MGVCVYDRFRDLEKPDSHRRLDVVLMATVSNFESLRQPTNHELRQFAGLFAPLFRQAGPETRRTVVAALSRCPKVPAAVARLIAQQPIDVSAPFLVNSASLDEAALAGMIAGGDAQMARAIARRKALSPWTVAALAATGDSAVLRSLRVRRLLPAVPDAEETDRISRDENLRERLRSLVGKDRQPEPGPAPEVLRPKARPGQIQRLLGFAAQREPLFFVTALADVLDCSFRLAERIMLDISGRQLADTLVAIGFDREAACVPLESFFPHLGRRNDGRRASQAILGECDAEAAAERLVLWLRADRPEAVQAPQLSEGLVRAGNEGTPVRTRAATREAAGRRALRRA